MAFHSYPHLIQKLFNAYWCGPPSGVTRTSSWTRVDHLVSRLPPVTVRPFQTRFRSGSATLWGLASPTAATRRFIMQKARRHHQRGSDRLQAHGFRDSFTPLRGVLFTFPSRYWFTIGLSRVFSLSGWSRRIHTGFHVTRATQGTAVPVPSFPYGAFTLCGAPFRALPVRWHGKCRGPTTPRLPRGQRRFGLFPVRSPLLGESLFIFSSCGY